MISNRLLTKVKKKHDQIFLFSFGDDAYICDEDILQRRKEKLRKISTWEMFVYDIHLFPKRLS